MYCFQIQQLFLRNFCQGITNGSRQGIWLDQMYSDTGTLTVTQGKTGESSGKLLYKSGLALPKSDELIGVYGAEHRTWPCASRMYRPSQCLQQHRSCASLHVEGLRCSWRGDGDDVLGPWKGKEAAASHRCATSGEQGWSETLIQKERTALVTCKARQGHKHWGALEGEVFSWPRRWHHQLHPMEYSKLPGRGIRIGAGGALTTAPSPVTHSAITL